MWHLHETPFYSNKRADPANHKFLRFFSKTEKAENTVWALSQHTGQEQYYTSFSAIDIMFEKKMKAARKEEDQIQ